MPSVELQLEQLDEIAKQVLAFAEDNKVFLLKGELGAGKTTLTKAMCKQLGVGEEELSSPSFGIVNEYFGSSAAIYHIDLYRLREPEEVFDIGIEEYASGNNYCFIEWPEIIEDWLNIPAVILEIQRKGEKRFLSLRK